MSRALTWLTNELEINKRRRALAIQDLENNKKTIERLRTATLQFDADIQELEEEIRQQEQIKAGAEV